MLRLAAVAALSAAAAAASRGSGDAAGPMRTAPIHAASAAGPVPEGDSSRRLADGGGATGVSAAAPVKDPFDMVDQNHDGSISRDEFTVFEKQVGSNAITGAVAKLTAGLGFWEGVFNSLAMIIVTELGDKTFFLSAILAMQHPRSLVFIGAMLALGLMHVLSVAIGFALPNLLPRAYTHYAATLLFLYFGGKLILEARTAGTDASEGLAEAEEELGGGKSDDEDEDDGDGVAGSGSDEEKGMRKKKTKKAEGHDDGASSVGAGSSSASTAALGGAGIASRGSASGTSSPRPGSSSSATAAAAATSSSSSSSSSGVGIGVKLSGAQAWIGIVVTAFTLNFLAEWGDRSQIGTIAMAAAKDPIGVCVGGIIGHAICTGIAVLGGRLLATRISERTVCLVGGCLFLAFAAHSVWVGPSVDHPSP